jgi:hypothetical protein
MRFARLAAADEWALRGLEDFVDAARVELLQLDYHRSRKLVAPPHGIVEHPEFAVGFRQPLQALNRALFLEPELRVITDAGWGDAYACVEQIAADLQAGGNRDVLVSAVRGSNVLPILDMLLADGVDLQHAETGAAWRTLKAQVLAADLKLGAGPLATALEEGARVVVAGSYDAAAPLAAAGRLQFGWQWLDFDLLAGAAAAAQAATARTRLGWHFGPQHAWGARPLVGELAADATCRLHGEGAFPEEEAAGLGQWLRSDGAASMGMAHADARVDFSGIECVRESAHVAGVRGARGAAPDGKWNLEIHYLAGYSTESFVAVDDCHAQTTEAVGAWLHARLAALEDASTTVSIRLLGNGAGGTAWLILECRSKKRRPCQLFIDEARGLVSRSHGLLRWGAGAPELTIESRIWPARVPRAAVDLAVDTRPAHEWL